MNDKTDTQYKFNDMQTATLALLGEAVLISSESTHPFLIVGGWSPYLLNSEKIRHPGTKDVDILFSEACNEGSLKEVISAFLQRGYILSAKHQFQLLKVIPVLDMEFVFNIDLLHPSLQQECPAGFVDHIGFPIPLSQFSRDTVHSKSIVLPNSTFLFDGHSTVVEKQIVLPSGKEVMVTIPVIDELGLVISKCGSINKQKRDRDAFDVYLALALCRDYSASIANAKGLLANTPDFREVLSNLEKTSTSATELNKRVMKYFEEGYSLNDNQLPDNVFHQFLNDVDNDY